GRAVHVAVDDERVLTGREQLGEADRADGAVHLLLEDVVLGDGAPQRELAAQRRDRFDPPAQLQLGLEQLVPPGAVRGRLTRETNGVHGIASQSAPPPRGADAVLPAPSAGRKPSALHGANRNGDANLPAAARAVPPPRGGSPDRDPKRLTSRGKILGG